MVYRHCGIDVLSIKNFITVNDAIDHRKVHKKWKNAFPVRKELTNDELLQHFYIPASDDDLSDDDEEDPLQHGHVVDN